MNTNFTVFILFSINQLDSLCNLYFLCFTEFGRVVLSVPLALSSKYSLPVFPITTTVMVVVVWLVLQLPVQLVTITTKVVSSTPDYREVCSIQHYVIKFVSDLRQVGGFLWVLLFSPPIKAIAMI